MAKIDTTEINWTPIISVFTVCATLMSAWWVYVKGLFKDKAEIRNAEAKQREDILSAFVNKLVDGRVDGKMSVQDTRINELSKALEKGLDIFRQEFHDFRDSTQNQIRDVNNTVTDIYREMKK